MGTITTSKKDTFGAESRDAHWGPDSYRDALAFLECYDRPSALQPVGRALPTPPRTVTNSLWLDDLRDFGPHEVSPEKITSVAQCAGAEIGQFNFNVDWQNHVRNVLAHCDFSSVSLPDFDYAVRTLRLPDFVRVTRMAGCIQDIMRTLWGEEVEDNGDLAGIAYADVDYPPKQHNYLDIEVEIDWGGTRVTRQYSDDDAEAWGP